MLTELRDAVAGVLEDAFAPTLDVFDRIPEDVNMLPCFVLGFPAATPSADAGVVFARTLTVYVIGRRVDAGDAEGELVSTADAAVHALGGTRGRRSLDRANHLAVESVTPRVVSVAGLDHDAYLISIESPYATC